MAKQCFQAMRTTVPKSITPEVSKFCKQVVAGGRPIYLKVQLVPESKALDCFENVRNKASKDGGSIQYGWRIWEWPRVMIEAEFHAVWLSPDNTYTDITPARENQILFLPDPLRIYEGKQINNVRVALKDNPLIHEFIEVNDRIHEEMNRGEFANKHGLIALPEHTIVPLMNRKHELMIMLSGGKIGRNDPCPCSSGLKYKKCHGR